MIRQLAIVILGLPMVFFGDPLFSSVTVTVSQVNPPCSFSGSAPNSLSYTCSETEANGSTSGSATPSMGSFGVMASAFAGSPNFAEATTMLSLSEPVIIQGGSGAGFASFTFCFDSSSPAFPQSRASFTFAGTHLQYGPFNHCLTGGPDTEVLPFQFGQTFQETATLSSDAVGASYFDNATFTWALNSITNSNGDVLEAAIQAVPEPSTAWLLLVAATIGLVKLFRLRRQKD